MNPVRTDSSAAFAVAIATGPFVLPVLGVRLGDLVFAVPLIVLAYAAAVCLAAARRSRTRRVAWSLFAAACGTASVASLLGLAAALAGIGIGTNLAFYTGVAGSVALVAACATLARVALREAGLLRLVDPALVGTVVVGVSLWLVVFPGLADGDVALTGIFVLDLIAFLLGALGIAAAMPRATRVALLGALGLAATGDGLVAAGSASLVDVSAGITALLWAAAGWMLAVGADRDRPSAATPIVDPAPPEDAPARAWAYVHVLLPLFAVLAYPVTCVVVLLTGGVRAEPIAYFGLLFLGSIAVAFLRQAQLLLENRRAVARERRTRGEAQRRAAELEALTGLATTMTQVLEEGPMVERGLDALRVAARTSSSALHFWEGGRPRLAAATGAWQAESVWAPPPEHLDAAACERRARRHIARLPLTVHGTRLGMVTLVRPEADGPFEREIELLRLLVDQLGIAVRNAREYREKVDLAVRDPLTGLYNRRFFSEAFDKEVSRHERYAASAAVVLFDIDDFKLVNDTFGHAAGDDVLRQIGDVVSALIRPADSFARIGGEEFAILMPETAQLAALLAAERVRSAVEAHRFLPDRQVTISCGVAALPQDGTSREELLHQADQALYWAKRNGKNLCAVASDALAEDLGEVDDGVVAHLQAAAASLDAGRPHTRGHAENVAAYAVAIGQALLMSPEHLARVRRAALLHDLGNLAVSDSLLSFQGPLTSHQHAQVRTHAEVGATMLARAGMHFEARWVRHHHERIDGRGYPDGLAGEAIPLEARIIAVAEAYDAMTSPRPYRHPMSAGEALAELRRCSGTQFDARLVDALVALVEREGPRVPTLGDAL